MAGRLADRGGDRGRGGAYRNQHLAHIDPQEALAGVTGKNRFEPGSMFSGRGGEARARGMLEDLCPSLKVLNDPKAKLG
jgi:hypothetical protein